MSNNNDLFKRLNKKADEKNRTPLWIGLGAGAMVIVCVGGFFLLGGTSDEVEPEPTKSGNTRPITDKEDDGENFGDRNEDDLYFWQVEGKEYPVDVEEWAASDITFQLEENDGILPEETIKKIDKSLWGLDIYSAAQSSLPLEAAGFTSDDAQMFLEDGTPNPMYSYWTAESFTREAGMSIERLLNPTFGGWSKYQYGSINDPAGMDVEGIFGGMFSNDFIKQNASNSPASYLPIYADWEKNDYGNGKLLSSPAPRWYGQASNVVIDFSYDTKTYQYKADYSADITYVAYDRSGGKLEKTGKLVLTFVANPNGDAGTGGKVLIDKASLSL